MKNKIVGIFICTLLIAAVVLPLVNSTDKNVEDKKPDSPIDTADTITENCQCKSNNFYLNGFSVMSDPLIVDDVDKDTTMHVLANLPEYFSWKDYNGQDWTTPAKDQGTCGSCWDFAALGALESVINIKEGLPNLDPDLSEQYVLSCLPLAANTKGRGCDGGDPWRAFKFIQSNTSNGNYCNGVIFESCMPYQAKDVSQGVACEEKYNDWEKYLVPISDCGSNTWLNHTQSILDQIKTQIMEKGPLAAGMNVTLKFQAWGLSNHNTTDYYPDPHEPWARYLNHIIVIVGWQDDETIGNGGYWSCKNSWGKTFGYDGFFNIEYGALFAGWYTAWAAYDPEAFKWPGVPKSNGPYYGFTNKIMNFTGDADGEHPPFTWLWEFGDGSTSTEQNPTHIYTTAGEYPVTLTVTDATDNVANESTVAWIQETNQPPSVPVIQGSSTIKQGEYCWYNFTFNDPDGSPVYFYCQVFGVDSDMSFGIYPDGEGIVNIYSYWEEKGEYIVKAKTIDPYGAESDWATLEVSVPYVYNTPPLLFWEHVFKRFPNAVPLLRHMMEY